jgi:hypothetical protein
VFLVHAPSQDERAFITLDEGLKSGSVKVTEKSQEQVNELLIENLSDSPLFLQEGDRLQGGKQDRTIIASLVIPPKSGQMPLPTFCIEQGRWHVGGQGVVFQEPVNPALAPKAVRMAAKVNMNQSDVWAEVLDQKVAAVGGMLAGNSNSSLNETLDSAAVKKRSDEFASALAGVLRDHRDAVGVAIAVNGTMEEVNVYPNHALLAKLYPRLLQSYALQATLEKDRARDARPAAAADVLHLMSDQKEKARPARAINPDNRLTIADLDNGANKCVTEYQGRSVHFQVLSAGATPRAPRNHDNPDSNRNPLRNAPPAVPPPAPNQAPQQP